MNDDNTVRRAVDHEDEVLERYATNNRDKSAHPNIHNHLGQAHHFVNRQTCKARRSSALAEWQNLAA